MPKFSQYSKDRLITCHPDLRRLLERAVEEFDCRVLQGVRTIEEQHQLYALGKTKTLNSKHLEQPDGLSHAVDVAPYPIDWHDRDRWYHFAGYVRGLAEHMGIEVRWGGDWDGDFTFTDQSFHDWPHFELM
jgi:hypothetical protein